MSAGTSTEWLFEDWQLVARALNAATHEECQCYECDTIDVLLGDIAHYWDLNKRSCIVGVGETHPTPKPG